MNCRFIKKYWLNMQDTCNRDLPLSSALSKDIFNSWKRCLDYNLSPLNFKTKKISSKELFQRQQSKKELIGLAIPIMEDIYKFIKNSGSIVILCDQDGIILKSFGDKSFVSEIEIGKEGTSWSEQSLGTNGVGTALFLKKPIQIKGCEHFYKENQIFTCSAAPIFDDNNNVIGVLDISSNFKNSHKHTLGMVVAAAKAVCKQLSLNRMLSENQRYLAAQATIFELLTAGLIVLDKDNYVSYLNQKAKDILKFNNSMVGNTIEEIILDGINFKSFINNPIKISDQNMDIKLKSGRISLSVSLIPILNEEGCYTGLIMTFKNIERVLRVVNRISGSQANFTFNDIIGKSDIFIRSKKLAQIAAKTVSNVLILGESGTGKELFAQSIHNYSLRKNRPFIVVNCGAIPRDLVQTELFGYAKGAFTGAKKEGCLGKFELADGGTIFLDEIGEMPMQAQVALLRVLQTGDIVRVGGTYSKTINVKVIAATNKDLQKAVKEKRFRKDLFYRLNVMTIEIPPLRERNGDIPLLVNFLADKISRKLCDFPKNITNKAMNILENYHYPGNVRELENIIERAVNVSSSDYIDENDLPICLVHTDYKVEEKNTICKKSDNLDIMEKDHLIKVLQEKNGNLKIVASCLGVSRSTVYAKLKKYRLNINEYRRR